MIAIPRKESPQVPPDSGGYHYLFEACIVEVSADPTPITQVSTADHIPLVQRTSPARTKPRSRSGWVEFMVVSTVLGGLMNLSLSNRQDVRRPQGAPPSVDQMDRMFKGLSDMPPLGRAQMELNRSEAITQADPRNARAFNTRAWIMATYPHASLRNGKKAVELATMACKLTRWQNPDYVATLAAAYAEAGDFQRAVAWQEKAQLSQPQDDPRGWKKRLALYQVREPYRDQANVLFQTLGAARSSGER